MWRSAAGGSPYAYAKASWIIGKSFLGKRLASLNGIHTLNELDKLIFPDNYKELPGKELLPDLERRIIKRSEKHIMSVINAFSQPPKLLTRMKASVSQPRRGEDSIKINSIKYYKGLIDCLWQLDSEDRELAAKLISDEISLLNSSLVLRLRSFYEKSEAEITKYLMDSRLLGNVYQKGISFEVKMAMDLSLDVRQEWKGWRWERFLNHEPQPSLGTKGSLGEGSPLAEAAEPWTIDPRHFQNAANQYLYHRGFHHFHSLPMSVSAIYCFIKLKYYEEDILTSLAEGLSLGMDSTSVFKLLEVSL